MATYDRQFYLEQQAGSLASAKQIVPLLLDIVRPQSVIDVGCGIGAWLSVCIEAGIEDIIGVDGDYVDRRMLLFPPSKFIPADLRRPIGIDRRFDLVMSLEVVEHLPNECERVFIDSLVKLGPAVLFAGSAPVRGGIGHVNEQWQSHWVRSFGERNYAMVDCIRPVVWDNPEVAWWYAQDALLFVEENWLLQNPGVGKRRCRDTTMVDVIHPRLFEEVIDPNRMSIRKALGAIASIPGRVFRKANRGVDGERRPRIHGNSRASQREGTK